MLLQPVFNDTLFVHLAGTETITGPKTLTTNPTISNAAPGIVYNDTTASANGHTVKVDGNFAYYRESAAADASLVVLDLANNRFGVGVLPSYGFDVTSSFSRFTGDLGITGNFGIGSLSPGSPITILRTITTTGTTNGIAETLTLNPGTTQASATAGLNVTVQTAGACAQDFTSSINGYTNVTDHNGSGTVASMASISAIARNLGASGIVTALKGGYSQVRNSSTGQVFTGYGWHIDVPTNSGTFNTYYGLYIGSPASLSIGTAYALYINGGDSYFGGNIGIGVATPLALLHLKAGTATANTAPIKFTSGTVLATPEAGVAEYDGKCFYTTPVASARGLSPSVMYSLVPAGDFNLQTAAGVQSAFPTTGDVWTLAGSTAYFFEGMYFITKTTGSITTAMAFALAGGASVTSIAYFVEAINVAADTTTATVNMTWVDTVSSTVINAAATTAVAIKFKGIIRMNAGGTVTPQINFSGTATAPVMKVNSHITFTPIGSNTNNLLGNVG